MKTDLCKSCGHCWVFQICWHIECSTFTASSFRIRNSSTGIPSHPLALFVVMLSKAHLTSHSRMSGSRWVITPLWLSALWRSFLYSSSVYSYHLFLISSAFVRSTISVLYRTHLCLKCSQVCCNLENQQPHVTEKTTKEGKQSWSSFKAPFPENCHYLIYLVNLTSNVLFIWPGSKFIPC